MGTIVGVAVLFGALILVGIIFGIVEDRKIRRSRRAGEKTRDSQSCARIVISQRVPSVTETLRGGSRRDRRDPGPRRRP